MVSIARAPWLLVSRQIARRENVKITEVVLEGDVKIIPAVSEAISLWGRLSTHP